MCVSVFLGFCTKQFTFAFLTWTTTTWSSISSLKSWHFCSRFFFVILLNQVFRGNHHCNHHLLLLLRMVSSRYWQWVNSFCRLLWVCVGFRVCGFGMATYCWWTRATDYFGRRFQNGRGGRSTIGRFAPDMLVRKYWLYYTISFTIILVTGSPIKCHRSF